MIGKAIPLSVLMSVVAACAPDDEPASDASAQSATAGDAGGPSPDAGPESTQGTTAPQAADASGATDARASLDAGAAGATDASTPSVLTDLGLSACGTPAGLAKFKPSNLTVEGLAAGPALQISGKCTLDTDTLTADCGYADAKPLPIYSVASAGVELTVLYVASFETTARGNFIITGKRPFALVAIDKIVHAGYLSAAPSKVNGYAAGGATGAATPQRRGFGPGGGAGASSMGPAGGASFCGRGGVGANSTMPAAEPYGTPELVPLVAGSSGGSGDAQSAAGGGALQLVAGRSITVSDTGTVSVPGFSVSGYAGGSSGGAILLEAPELTVQGALAANGAAAGEYYGGVQGTASNERAYAGASGHGEGSAGALIDGTAGTRKGAAGGGGAGRIRLNAACPVTFGPTVLVTPARETPCYSQGMLSPR
jgi:hypothetical protein